MRRLPRRAIFASLLLLVACKDITHVQTGYVADRDECRGKAENNAGVYSQPESYPLSEKERNTALLQLFCECMRDKDWKVAGCPKPPPPTVATAQPAGPTVVVVQSPAGQPAVMPAAGGGGGGPAPAPRKKGKGYCPPPSSVCNAPVDTTTPATPDQENQQLQGILQRQ